MKKTDDKEYSAEYNEARFSNYYGISVIGLAVVFSALCTIPILFVLSVFIKNTLRYNMYTLGIFLLLTIIIKLLLEKYVYEAAEHYFSYYFFLENLKDDFSAKSEYIMSVVILIATLIASAILFNYRTLLEFGIMLSLLFLGFSMASIGAQIGETPLGPLPFKPIEPPQDVETRSYKWKYDSMDSTRDDIFSAIAHISKKALECARSKPRIKLTKKDDIYKWVVYPEAVTEEVKEVALQLREISKDKGFYKIEEITNVLSLVQQAIPYSYDKDSAPHHEEEYPRYPIETLYDKTGDCECKTFLVCSLLTTLGYETVYFALPGHVALGVASDARVSGYFKTYKGKRYYYYETTAEGWRFGQIPAKERGKIEAVVPVKFKSQHDLSDCPR